MNEFMGYLFMFLPRINSWGGPSAQPCQPTTSVVGGYKR